MAGNTSNLTFKLFGKDVSASKAFKGVGAAGASASKSLGGAAKGAGLALAGIGAAAAIAGTALAVDFAGKAISAASNMNETLSKTSVMFGKQSASIVKWSEGAAASMGQSSQQALDAASTFATFGRGAGLSGKSLEKFAEQNTQLAGDMASFFNTSPEQAIEAIGAAFRGEAEPIRKYGVLLDDASMRQEAVRMGIIKNTKTALTPQQKVLVAQALIMKQTSAAQGDFARTSGGLANQQRILSAGWENLTAKVGAYFLPIALKVVGFLNKNLIPTVTAIADGIKIFFDALTGNSELNEFDGALRSINNAGIAFRAVWDTVFAWVTGTLIPAIKNLADAFMKNVWPAIVTVAGIIAENLMPVVAALQDFWTNTLLPAFSDLMPILQKVGTWVGVLVGVLAVAISWIVGKVAPVFYAVLGGAIKIVIAVLGKVVDAIQWVIDHFGGFIDFAKKIPGKIADAFKGLVAIITAPFRLAFNGIAMLWNNTVGRLSFGVPDWVPGMGGKGFDVPDIPMLANGGIVSRPTLALIGEAGPEAVVPLSRGGGMGTHYHLHLDGVVVGNSRTVGRDLLAAIQNANVVSAVRPAR